MKKHTLYCFIGASGSGKTTLVDAISQRSGMRVLKSYTTRPKRHEDDTDHIYITQNDYFHSVALQNKVATTCINGNFYCATAEQVEESDLYVVDWRGITKILNALHGNRLHNVNIKMVYIYTPVLTRIWRMFKRGDGIKRTIERLISDRKDGLSDKKFAQSHADFVLKSKDYHTIDEMVDDFIAIKQISEQRLMLEENKRKRV